MSELHDIQSERAFYEPKIALALFDIDFIKKKHHFWLKITNLIQCLLQQEEYTSQSTTTLSTKVHKKFVHTLVKKQNVLALHECLKHCS